MLLFIFIINRHGLPVSICKYLDWDPCVVYHMTWSSQPSWIIDENSRSKSPSLYTKVWAYLTMEVAKVLLLFLSLSLQCFGWLSGPLYHVLFEAKIRGNYVDDSVSFCDIANILLLFRGLIFNYNISFFSTHKSSLDIAYFVKFILIWEDYKLIYRWRE